VNKENIRRKYGKIEKRDGRLQRNIEVGLIGNHSHSL
jgi:hypothetical protein